MTKTKKYFLWGCNIILAYMFLISIGNFILGLFENDPYGSLAQVIIMLIVGFLFKFSLKKSRGPKEDKLV